MAQRLEIKRKDEKHLKLSKVSAEQLRIETLTLESDSVKHKTMANILRSSFLQMRLAGRCSLNRGKSVRDRRRARTTQPVRLLYLYAGK